MAATATFFAGPDSDARCGAADPPGCGAGRGGEERVVGLLGEGHGQPSDGAGSSPGSDSEEPRQDEAPAEETSPAGMREGGGSAPSPPPPLERCDPEPVWAALNSAKMGGAGALNVFVGLDEDLSDGVSFEALAMGLLGMQASKDDGLHRELLRTVQRVGMLLTDKDEDGDGELSLDEFIQLLKGLDGDAARARVRSYWGRRRAVPRERAADGEPGGNAEGNGSERVEPRGGSSRSSPSPARSGGSAEPEVLGGSGSPAPATSSTTTTSAAPKVRGWRFTSPWFEAQGDGAPAPSPSKAPERVNREWIESSFS